MSKIIPQSIALAVVSGLVLCHPAFVAASALKQSSLPSHPGSNTLLALESERSGRITNEQNRNAVAGERTPTKSSPRAKTGKISKKSRTNFAGKARRLSASHHAHFGDREDCDACHTQCLISSLACIAISIASGCPACGAICLVYQAACEATCNTTTACKNSGDHFFLEQ